MQNWGQPMVVWLQYIHVKEPHNSLLSDSHKAVVLRKKQLYPMMSWYKALWWKGFQTKPKIIIFWLKYEGLWHEFLPLQTSQGGSYMPISPIYWPAIQPTHPMMEKNARSGFNVPNSTMSHWTEQYNLVVTQLTRIISMANHTVAQRSQEQMLCVV